MLLHIFWDRLCPPGYQVPVSRLVSSILDVDTAVSENPVRIMGYSTARHQVDAQALLDSIGTYKHRHDVAGPVLLVVHQDLFRDGNSFVFGLARESAGAGVVSTARLANEYYGREGSDDDFIDRVAKEGAHEVGHLLGLPHCSNRECVMFKPDTLDELDRKKKVLCPSCRDQLDARMQQGLSSG